ncbi:MAG: hypothetical protein K9G02_03350 [Microbacteriaceae bacterium]|nr:hypothetical protein [Microbacteriaceae bacterium]
MTSAVQLAAKAIRTALLLGGIVTLGIAVVGGAIGYWLVGPAGIWSALIGSAIAFVFMGITAGSILLGQKASGGSIASGVFFAIVLGSWLLKFVLFLVVAFAIRNTDSLDTVIAFSCVIAAVLGALVSDVVAISRARVPIVDMV